MYEREGFFFSINVMLDVNIVSFLQKLYLISFFFQFYLTYEFKHKWTYLSKE